MIVVDANVIAYFWIPGDFTELARKLLLKEPKWISVPLWRSELRSIVTQYVRQSMMLESVATDVLRSAFDQMNRNECSVSNDAVMKYVFASRASAYDCEYIALATEKGVPLVTCDKPLIRAFPDVAVHLTTFLEQS